MAVKSAAEYWTNTKKVIAPDAVKPCKKLAFCPYGQIVELYPIQEKRGVHSCKLFGHDCPVYYLAEKAVGA